MKNDLMVTEADQLMKLEGLEQMKVDGIDIVPVYTTDEGERVVDGRELYAGVQSKRDFSNWVKSRLVECDAVEHADYCSFAKIVERETGASTRTEYIIKLDTAKEMAMLERNEVGKAVRKYFIAVDNHFKETAVQAQQLSPILQVAINLELEQKRQAEKLAILDIKMEKNTETLEVVRDALIHDTSEGGFVQWVNATIRKIAQSSAFPCLDDGLRYSMAWSESYDRLNKKRACRLKQRVQTARENAAMAGATKTQVKSISNLAVIVADRDLKPVYESVIREMMIAYCVK